MGLIERRIERAIEEGEDVLTGQLGDPPNEEAWADLADMVIGDLADDYRGAVVKLDAIERHIASLERAPDVRDKDRAVVLRRVLLNASGEQ